MPTDNKEIMKLLVEHRNYSIIPNSRTKIPDILCGIGYLELFSEFQNIYLLQNSSWNPMVARNTDWETLT
jgi:hypothetical protein